MSASAHAIPLDVTYDREDYAIRNTPIETTRHFARVIRYLRPHRADRLLEVGCGRGWLTQRVKQNCPDTVGVDVNPRAIANAVTENTHLMDATHLEFEDESFDHVYSFHVIEHIVDIKRAIAEMARVVAPGGRILLVYPAEPVRGLFAMPGAWMGFGNPFLARRLHVHKLTPNRMLKLARELGLWYVQSSLDLLLTPQFVTVLEKPKSAT